MTMHEQLAIYTSMTDDMLHELLKGVDMSKILRDSMSYSVFAGGKRLRPALCMAGCELVGGEAEDAVLPACALEMIHAYSLIHDDLPALDNDDMRRGKPSNHIAFGEANAVIAGDGLQAMAFLVLARLEKPLVTQAVAQGAFDMVVGQSYDLTASDNDEMLNVIHRLKTGALIKASLLSGAYCASPSQRELAALTAYAEQFGLLFQITDDILDVTGDAALLGKSIGKDESEHKLTFVTRYGLEGAKTRAREIAEKAHEAMLPFGERAWFFDALTDHTLNRRA